MTAPPRVKRDCQCPRAQHRHGTVSAYNSDRCRCQPCTTARCRHTKRWRRSYALRAQTGPVGLIPGCGTQRRLRALAAIGWSTTRIGVELGVAQQRISELQHTDCRVRVDLAARVAAAYDRLWDAPPLWAGAERSRRTAARKGWAPPMAWDDDEIDEPAAQPHTPEPGGPWELKPCGTTAAYRRHLRAGEKPDRACVEAEARQKAARRQAARARRDQDTAA